MLKNKIWLGIILSIILLIFSIPGFTAYYKYTQESGTNFYVGTGDKADALEDTNEMRQIIDDLGALLVHSKRDGLYPKNGLFGGTIQIPEAGLKFSNDPVNDDIAAYIAGEMTWQTKAELGIDLSLYYLKTAIDTKSEMQTIWSVILPDLTGTPVQYDYARFTDADTIEGRNYAEVKADLGIDLTLYYLKTAIDTIGEVEAIWVKDIIDSDELAALKFTDLADTPANYTDQAGKYVKVNAGETALEFGTPTGGAETYLELTDTPVAYDNGKYAKSTADGVVWDTPAGGGTVTTSGTPEVNDIARFTGATVIEGLSYAEFKAALDLEIGTDVLAEQTIGIANDNLLEVDDADAADNDYAKFTANGLEGRSYAELMMDTNPVTTVTEAHTMTVAEAGTVLVSCAATPYTITLPTAVGYSGLRYHFIKTDANYFLITLDGDGTETLNYENSTGTPNLTYGRLNTLCAEVTVVSDNANWQVIDEALGQVPFCWAYNAVENQNNLPDTEFLYIMMDSEEYDIGGVFDNSEWISGSATATSANHLVDTVNNQFTAAMVGMCVVNDTDTTYAYITAYNSTSDVTISSNIFVNTELYSIDYARFIAPIPGKYLIGFSVHYLTCVTAKRYLASIYKNGNDETMRSTLWTNSTTYIGTGNTYVDSLSKDNYLQLRTYMDTGESTSDIWCDKKTTYLQVRLISKD